MQTQARITQVGFDGDLTARGRLECVVIYLISRPQVKAFSTRGYEEQKPRLPLIYVLLPRFSQLYACALTRSGLRK